MPLPIIVHVGQRFNSLVILETGLRKNKQRASRCKCDCGNETTVHNHRLATAGVKSCGCARVTHGYALQGAPAPIYRTWCGMVHRCTNPSDSNWEFYGGKGIKVCDRWRSFELFLADVGERPEGTSLDRIDGNKGYEPGNTRWADRKTQNRNAARNVNLTLNGKAQCVSAWAEELDIEYGTLLSRKQKYGWSDERALTEPVRRP